ncbi:hypothetical protein KSS87_006369 [Heliosperma pusillum]|nr:hypothetical protein KSS87_006369 [Heliosperma pusillum]
MAEDCSSQCGKWAIQLIGHCFCFTKEGISLSLGLVSVASWGVAEIPQIVTNFRTKSTEGLSFAFLLTWIIGDFFNLFGCLLEPATLPTQFYMALLYTITTLTLTLQSVYYGYVYPRLKSDRLLYKNGKPIQSQCETVGHYNQDDTLSGDNLTNDRYGQMPISSMTQSSSSMSSPIPLPPLPRSHSADQDSFYMSARSLSTSHTPTRSSYLAPRRGHMLEDVTDSFEAPLLGGSLPNEIIHPSKTKNLCCAVSAVTFILGTLNLTSSKVTSHGLIFELSKTRAKGYESRKLLQVNQMINSDAGGHATVGSYLGWAMAAIYMGGRLPQIWLNMRRGHVDGLNPLMFIFALLGNTTYVASILVNSLDWLKIMPNMPWLVDAGGCALLDTFVSFCHV